MVILQAGVAKSGNFWLYKIIREVYFGLPYKSFIQNHPIHELAKGWDLSHKYQADTDVLDIEPESCFYRIGSIFRMPIEDIDEYIDQCSHVWTHSAICDRSLSVLKKFDKIIYIIRDPRDVAVSMSRFAFTPYMKKYYPCRERTPETYLQNRLDGILRHWVRHVGGYLQLIDELNLHIVFYERLLYDFDTELRRLLEYLGVEAEEESIRRIKEGVDFKTMRQENPMHVRKGRSNQWQEIFTGEQKKRAVHLVGPMLKLLNYPTDQSKIDYCLPRLPENTDGKCIGSAIKQSLRTPFWAKVNRIYRIISQ